MAVKYVGGGGFNPFGILGSIASVVPGGQAIAPWLFGAGAVTSAAQGDWQGAGNNAYGAAKFINWDGFKPKANTQPFQWQKPQMSLTNKFMLNNAPGMFDFKNDDIFQQLWNDKTYWS